MSYHLPNVGFGTLGSTPTPVPVTYGRFIRYDNLSLNSVADYQITGFPASWLPHRFCVTGSNGLVSTAQIGLYSAQNGLGTVIAPPQIIKNITTADDYCDLEFSFLGKVINIASFYIRVVTPQIGRHVDVIITFDDITS